MTILEIFEKVNLIIPIEQRIFFNFFEDTVNELQALYGDFVFMKTIQKNGTQSDDSSNVAVDYYGNVYINGNLAKDVNYDELMGNATATVLEYIPPSKLSDDNVVLPLYHNSIVDNILYLADKGETYKGEFIRKSKAAYLKYWNDSAKGRRIRRMRW